MTLHYACLVALALTACAPTSGDLSGDDRLEALRADRNVDGLITQDEWLALVGREFSRLDVDADGQISADEAPTTIFVNEEDNDRVLRKSEAPTLTSLADANDDDQVTIAELDAVYAKALEFDGDGNGLIDRSEYETARQARFDSFDLNGDGVIDTSEFRLSLLRF